VNIWSDFIQALGQDENGAIVTGLCKRVGEFPVISESPDDYNDPEGKTRFYKFINSGIEIGFRLKKLSHIHFFVQPHEGYAAYTEDMFGCVAQAWNARNVISELGSPSKEGLGRVDFLIGYVQQWLKYEFGTYALRMEFSKDGRLWKATIMSSASI